MPLSEALLSDRAAIDQIQSLLDRQEWTPDTIDRIADIIRETGRDVKDLDTPWP